MNGEITTWEASTFAITLIMTNPELTNGFPSFVVNPELITTPDGDYPVSEFFYLRTPLQTALLNFFVYLILSIPMIILAWPKFKDDYLILKKECHQNKTSPIGKLMLGGLLGLALVLIGNVTVMFLTNMLAQAGVSSPTAANQIAISRMLQSQALPIMLVTVVIIGPIVEELVFRKLFFGLIPNVWIALATSTIVFTLIHLSTEMASGDWKRILLASLGYLPGGIGLGLIYIKYKKNIFVPIIAHMLVNLLASLAIFLI
jgi:membrane protease YdiL (CAAX protease family)